MGHESVGTGAVKRVRIGMDDCAHGSTVITKGTAELGMAVQADAVCVFWVGLTAVAAAFEEVSLPSGCLSSPPPL